MGGTEGFQTYPGGRMRCSYCTIDRLIQLAYDVQPFQIAGGSDRNRREGYDILAILPPSSETDALIPSEPCPPLTGEQKLMVQALLTERFHLKFHRESRTIPKFILVKGSESPKLRPSVSSPSRPNVWISLNQLEGRNATMTLLAARLSEILKRPVVDETGFEGSFDFKNKWSNSSDGFTEEGVAAIITDAVEEIGLELKASVAPVDTVVIDRIEQPSLN
jgi:uncharacterized protein (TIGR03435 family)